VAVTVKASLPPSELVQPKQQATSVADPVFRIATFEQTCAASVTEKGRCNLLEDIMHIIRIMRTEEDVDMEMLRWVWQSQLLSRRVCLLWLGILHRAEVAVRLL